MLIAVLAMLAQQATTSDWLPRVTFTSASELRARLVRCGVSEAKVSVRESRELQETVAYIAGAMAVSDHVLPCIAQASLDTGYYVEFADAAIEPRYASIYADQERLRGVEDARAALRRHGLLERLPRFDGNPATLTAYAGKLETLCGVSAGSLLQLASASTLTIRSKAMGAATGGHAVATEDRFICVIDAIAASNLHEHGIDFGFIGNEALTPAPSTGGDAHAQPPPTAKPPS